MTPLGIINKSMRQNYNEHGIEKYYTLVGSSYRNPHFPAIRQCLFTWMDRWWAHEGSKLNVPSVESSPEPPLASSQDPEIRVLDMAAGSGEATLCVTEWWKNALYPSTQPQNIVIAKGSEITFLPFNGSMPPTSRPPFIPPSRRPLVPQAVASDRTMNDSPKPTPFSLRLLIAATDPFTVDAYSNRTGLSCCSPLSFQDLALGLYPETFSLAVPAFPFPDPSTDGEVSPSNPTDMIICSFALHLVGSPSELFALLLGLSTKARWLVIISPHKKPEIKASWGWALWDTERWMLCSSPNGAEILRERVHCRVFSSLNLK